MTLNGAIAYFPNRAKAALRAAYYRWWFESGSPWAQFLERRLDRWENDRPLAPITISRTAWEADYAKGRWDFLRDVAEVPRNSVIVGLLRHLASDASVLDVGCGEGELFNALRPYGYKRFVGIDISQTAISKIAPASDERTSFLVASAEDSEPPGIFDVIVFNESLYYFKNPLTVLARYARSLAPDGMIVISIFHGPTEVLALLRRLKRKMRVLANVRITNQSATWSVLALQRDSSE